MYECTVDEMKQAMFLHPHSRRRPEVTQQNPTTAVATVHPQTVMRATKPGSLHSLASMYECTVEEMKQAMFRQVFRGEAGKECRDEDFLVLAAIAGQYKLNPLVPGQLYAYKHKDNSIQVMIGPDGVWAALASNPDYDGMDEPTVVWDEKNPTKSFSITVRLWFKNRRLPATYTAFMSDWFVASRGEYKNQWESRPYHMLYTKAVKYAAKQVMHGLPIDRDEFQEPIEIPAAQVTVSTQVMREASVPPLLTGPAPSAPPVKEVKATEVKKADPAKQGRVFTAVVQGYQKAPKGWIMSLIATTGSVGEQLPCSDAIRDEFCVDSVIDVTTAFTGRGVEFIQSAVANVAPKSEPTPAPAGADDDGGGANANDDEV